MNKRGNDLQEAGLTVWNGLSSFNRHNLFCCLEIILNTPEKKKSKKTKA